MTSLDATRRPALGWRIAIVFVGVLLIWLAVQRGAIVLFGADYGRGRHLALAVASTTLAVPLIVLARRYLDRRTWAGLGWTSMREGWRALLIGIACYLVPALAALAVVVYGSSVRVQVSGSGADVLQAVAFAAVLVLLYEAFPEELAFRGYLYRNLLAATSPRDALIGQALLFASWGVVLWAVSSGISTVPQRFPIFLGLGLVVGAIRLIVGNLWAPIGFHLAFQTTVQLFGNYWDEFTTTDLVTLQSVALGFIPLLFAVPFLYLARAAGLVGRQPTNWQTPEPDQ